MDRRCPSARRCPPRCGWAGRRSGSRSRRRPGSARSSRRRRSAPAARVADRLAGDLRPPGPRRRRARSTIWLASVLVLGVGVGVGADLHLLGRHGQRAASPSRRPSAASRRTSGRRSRGHPLRRRAPAGAAAGRGRASRGRCRRPRRQVGAGTCCWPGCAARTPAWRWPRAITQPRGGTFMSCPTLMMTAALRSWSSPYSVNRGISPVTLDPVVRCRSPGSARTSSLLVAAELGEEERGGAAAAAEQGEGRGQRGGQRRRAGVCRRRGWPRRQSSSLPLPVHRVHQPAAVAAPPAPGGAARCRAGCSTSTKASVRGAQRRRRRSSASAGTPAGSAPVELLGQRRRGQRAQAGCHCSAVSPGRPARPWRTGRRPARASASPGRVTGGGGGAGARSTPSSPAVGSTVVIGRARPVAEPGRPGRPGRRPAGPTRSRRRPGRRSPARRRAGTAGPG